MKHLLLCLAIASAALSDLQGAALVFVNIIDSTSPQFSAFGSRPSINNAGTIAFIATRDGGGTGIFTKTGAGPVTTIADSATDGLTFSLLDRTTINSSGTVAFANTDLTGGAEGVFSGNGGPLTTIALTTGAQFNNFGNAPSINDGGTVVFSAQRDAGPSGIYAHLSGTITTVNEGSTQYGDPMINNSDTVAFSVRQGGVFTRNGSSPVVTVANRAGPLDEDFAFEPVINDAGTVIFDAVRDDFSEGIFSGNGGPLTTVVDDDGPFSSFDQALAINAGGRILFMGSPDVENDGIFFGPNPTTDAIIQEGDTLFGSTVDSFGLSFAADSLNDLDQFVFWYELTDGRSGLAMVTVPEPGSAIMTGIALLALGAGRRRPLG